MITFERIEICDKTYSDQNRIGEVNIFQTPTWLHFVAGMQNAEPVIAVVKSDGIFMGYFTALISHVFGAKILGSPPKGAISYFMGFNLLPIAPKHEILQTLPRFAFGDLGCHYLEVIDPNLIPTDWEESSYRVENRHYYGIDLCKSEDELFASMDHTGRNCIRKSIKNGVVVEEATDMAFADDYYAQYENVLARHSITPTYSLDTVRKLIECILPTGNLLLLRARTSDGTCIATGIFLALNKSAVFWGAASWQQYQYLRPNEPIAWYGMKNMRARGIQTLHLGEKCEHYKEKLGAKELQLYRIMKTKHKLIDPFLYPLISPRNEEYRKYRNWLLKRIGYYKN